ncbi:hypothetical protein MTO98_30685 [Mucilaginibacter sp. SMC90]|uniref:hypothetical protein n=1 Tax=Mucilaginibacter sp. SMC90 TaxID=2929803 RepID=UPI001FB2E7CA|nr:hypothetical protein [Mucilaginibacter sp. SMC90]UOE48769.1 hypothetical protein MTO98_30685 [Mucilaginibacter sp. SMC90]
MRTQRKNRIIQIKPDSPQWKIQQLFGAWAGSLDRLPDAGEVRRNPPRSAPLGVAEMVF